MANRLLKDGICTSDAINMLSSGSEVLFYRLFVVADDYGRMDGRVQIIKSQCFPLKDLSHDQIIEWLRELCNANLIEFYSVDGKSFFYIKKWEQRQRNKEKYPSPDLNDNSNLPQIAADCGLGLGLGLGEGKGKGRGLEKGLEVSDVILKTPQTGTKTNKKEKSNLFFDVTEQTQAEFKKLRSAKKAPITERAITAIRSEATKAGITLEAALIECCDRGWAGFKAEWYIKSHAPPRSINKADALLEKNRISTQHWRPPEMRQQNEN